MNATVVAHNDSGTYLS